MAKVVIGTNDIKTLYPEIAKQWHPTLNGDILLESVAFRSNKKYFWLCDKGHSYECTPDKRVSGEGCPYCNNRRLLVGYNDLETKYPNLATEWDYSLNDGTPKEYTFRSTYKAHWKCLSCGHKWSAKIRDRVDSKYKSCPKCTAAKRGEEKHNRVLAEHGGIVDPLLLTEWDYEKNDRGPGEYTPHSNDNVYWICSKCGYHFRAKINNRTLRKSCACCSGKVVVAGKNDFATTHPNLAKEWHPTKNGDLHPSDVTYGMAKRIWWVCPEGHEYPATPNHRSSGTNCPICNSGRQTSFAEQAVYYYVKKVFPDAISRYTEIFSNGMELDIYIPSIKLGVEYDGMAWHKSDKLLREKKKYKICQDNGIHLIRLMEKPSEGGILTTADESITIMDGPMHEKKHIAKVIRLLLDKIDPESNPWTRQKPVYHSSTDINLDRDEAEIRSYMTKVKNGSFAEQHPALAEEWHPTKNGRLSPDKVKPHSDINVWWTCPTCGYEYSATVGHRVSGTGCPKCGFRKSAQAKQKSVIMLDPVSYEELRLFDSISEASQALGINSSNISMVCKGHRNKAGGFSWKYANIEHDIRDTR